MSLPMSKIELKVDAATTKGNESNVVPKAEQNVAKRHIRFIPILFTLGSSAVMEPGRFYEESLKAAQNLGKRAVLLAGPSADALRARGLPDSIHVAQYAPYSMVMPRAAARARVRT